MLKKAFLGFMAVCAIGFGFVSCSNDSDDEEDTVSTQMTDEQQSQDEKTIADNVAGTYTVNETYTVYSQTDTSFQTALGSKSAESVSVKIEAVSDSSDKVNITIPGIQFTGSLTVYSFVATNVEVATSDNEEYTFTLGEFSSTATKDDGTEVAITGVSVSGTLVKSTKALTLTAVYKQGAMPLLGKDDFSPVSTSASANVVSPLFSVTSLNSDYYGVWEGTWTIFGVGFDTTVIVGSDVFAYSSSMMTGSYEYVSWGTDTDGNVVCYGSHTEGEANEASCGSKITFKSDGYGYFWVRAMSLFSSPAQLSKQ
ncbi:MAG: hypothetical protein IJ673_03865 [Treponema sp.]|nr:hypothetical protein [Treponema sp.]